MRKALKITCIVLGSLIGLVIRAAISALTTVTSPKRLTKLVKKYVPQYVNFETDLERASLTLFKTFPDIGLQLDNLYILSPMADAPSDTLAKIGQLVVSANAKKFLKEDQIVVNRCILDNAKVNLFTDTEGHSNLDIFSSESDDTISKPFNYSIDLQEVSLNNATISYIERSQGLTASAQGLDLDVKGSMKDQDIKAVLSLKANDLTLNMSQLDGELHDMKLTFEGAIANFNDINGKLNVKAPIISLNAGYQLFDNDHIHLELPLQLRLKPLEVKLDDTSIGLNDYLIALKGEAAQGDQGDTDIDLAFSTNTLVIEDVMRYLPESVVHSLNGIEIKGHLDLSEGLVQGVFNDSLMPVIRAKATATDATVSIPQLPYPFTKVNISTSLGIDLNDSINAREVTLAAMMNRSKIDMTGQLCDLSNKMALDLTLKSNLAMTDLKPFLPKNTKLGGDALVNMTLKGTLDDFLNTVTKFQFNNRLKADASVAMKNFDFAMDSIHALSPKLDLNLTLPASRKTKGRSGAFIGLKSENLDASMGVSMQAALKGLQLTATADHLSGGIEDILMAMEMALNKLDFTYDSIAVEALQPQITMETSPQKNKGLGVRASFNSKDLHAKAGPSNVLNSQSLKVVASAKENKAKDDFLNRWNPTADFTLSDAELQMANFGEKIVIPTIDFLFDSHELGFKKGTVKVGKSDLTLEGNVIGIKEWIDDSKNLMKADFQVTSNYLDINEIMDLTSGMGAKGENEEPVVEEVATDDHPFMVPEGIDFTFGIKAKRALYDNFDLNSLSGTATVKDGTLLLREIGFTNEAAEMQLTAIYQSPRKNHLFLGMDFHLLNVQIYDLLHMIPEIDTIVPMLKTFDGAAEFHIAAQTNLKSNYEPKMSTLRASADIEGANLRVKDIASFTKITDMLKVSTNGEYKIDSIDIQMTVFRNEVDLWPFQIALGKYKATLDGHYNLNTIGEYHISVTDSPLPTRLGLKISGPLNDLSYSLEPCKYPHLYRPERRSDTEQMVMELKRLIASKLKENVL